MIGSKELRAGERVRSRRGVTNENEAHQEVFLLVHFGIILPRSRLHREQAWTRIHPRDDTAR